MFVAGRNDKGQFCREMRQAYTPLESQVLSWHLQAHGEGT
jgi:hypothetical protein